MSESERAVRWIVSGRVQGVGYRWFILRRAEQLAVSGWVRNLPDGRVEVVAKGSADALGNLESVLKSGPRLALVENVEKDDVPHEHVQSNSFDLR